MVKCTKRWILPQPARKMRGTTLVRGAWGQLINFGIAENEK
jgi:hypothetical protein